MRSPALAHASTVATNAIIELKGARTGLITTKGFRDVLEMRRLRIPVLYDLQYRKPPPLVPRRLRLEIDERMGPRGAVWAPLDEQSVIAAAKALRDAGVQSIAISLLHSYAESGARAPRRRDRARACSGNVYVTCSADVLPEIREYERTSTAVVSAYVGPVVRDYLDALERDIRGIGIRAPLQIMQSNGGIMSLDGAREKPAYTVESGPAAGVIASARMARALGLANAISLDMGGTTAKAAMIENGEPARTTEYEVGSGINLSSKLVKGGGYPIKLPFIDVSEIGAGGGSIVSLDAAGNLSVGPRSAGAVPGPVCYGAGGTEPTFTDAALVAGYLNPAALAGGRVKLDAAQRARDPGRAHRKAARPAARRGRLRHLHDRGGDHDARRQGGDDLSRARSARLRADRLRRQRPDGGRGGRPRAVDPQGADPAGARRVQRARASDVRDRARVLLEPVPRDAGA